MSDANRVALTMGLEATYGVADGSAAHSPIRITSETLRQATNTTNSDELRSDRQIADFIRTGLNAEGDINFELSYGGAFHDLLAAVVQADNLWATPDNSDTADSGHDEISVTKASGVDWTARSGATPANITDTGTPFSTIVTGDWLRSDSASNSSNDGYFKVISAVSDTQVNLNGDVVADTGDSSGTLDAGEWIENGTTLRTYTIDRQFQDLESGAAYARFTGMAPNTLTLNVATEQIITGSIGFLGKIEVSDTVASGASVRTDITNTPMNAVDNVHAFFENDIGGLNDTTDNSVLDVQSFTLSINNNLRTRLKVGTLGAFELGSGTIDINGSFTAYYSDASLIDRYLDFTTSSIAFVFKDAEGNAYAIDIPNVKFSNAQRVAGGINTDVVAEVSFQGFRTTGEGEDTTIGRTISMHKWDV